MFTDRSQVGVTLFPACYIFFIILMPTIIHHPAMRSAEVVQKLKIGHSSASIRCIAEVICLSCNKDRL